MLLLAGKQVKCQKAVSDLLLPPQKQNISEIYMISAVSTLQSMNLQKSNRRLLTMYSFPTMIFLWFPTISCSLLPKQRSTSWWKKFLPEPAWLMAPKKSAPSKRTRLFTSPGAFYGIFVGDGKKILMWSCQPLANPTKTLCFSCCSQELRSTPMVWHHPIIIKIPPQHNRPSGWCGHRGSWWRKTSPDSKFWSFCPENIGGFFFQEVPTILHDSGSLGVFTRHEEVFQKRRIDSNG